MNSQSNENYGGNMLGKLKKTAIAKGEKIYLAHLQKANAELLVHFDAVLARFKQDTGGNPAHKPMADSLEVVVNNLRITGELLTAQESMAGGHHV